MKFVREWRRRRKLARTTDFVLEWLDDCEAMLARYSEAAGAEPLTPYPRDWARANPAAAIENMCALLRAVDARLVGADAMQALAVFQEHRA